MTAKHHIEEARGLPRSVPELTMIGVPEGLKNRAPSIAAFPRRFNPEARNIWASMFNAEDKVCIKIKEADGVEDQWYIAIVEFLKRCEMMGVLPFTDTTDESKNDAVIHSLTLARQHLVKFVDRIKLFERIKLRKACREYVLREHGFEVRAWAHLRTVWDPTFESWLNQAPLPRFLRGTDNRYEKHIQPNVQMWCRYLSSTRVTIGYDIQVGTVVSVPGKRLATRKEIDKFIDKLVWLPIIRAHRFKGLTSRLF